MRSKRLKITLSAIAICVLCISIGMLSYFLYENNLDKIQREAIEALERDVGKYDDKSIVLIGTSKARAEELAQILGADLRILMDLRRGNIR